MLLHSYKIYLINYPSSVSYPYAVSWLIILFLYYIFHEKYYLRVFLYSQTIFRIFL